MRGIDMSIPELEQYMGTNPKPQDFDEYWSEAIKEMKQVKPEVSFEKSKHQFRNVECFDMYFTGVKGARIHVQYLHPQKSEDKIPAVLMFHGYSWKAGEWSHKLEFVSQGFAVFALDVRGQAGKSEDVGGMKGITLKGHVIRGLAEEDPHNLLFRDIFLDTAQLAGIVMDMDSIDETKVCVYGGSMGGGLSIACAALEPRIARAAVSYPFLSDYKRVWEMNCPYEEMIYYFRANDPRHEHDEETFRKLGYIDIQNLASRVKAKILMFTGLMDEVCPPSTQYAVYNKLTCEKEHILYPDYGHEELHGSEDMKLEFLNKVFE